MSTAPPNVLWICTDQQRFDTIAALGNPHIHTPHLDRLVGEGVAFTHTYCQSPICTPSRGSFLTSRYPRDIRACVNGNEQWAEAAPLVPQLLRDGAGYRCGLIGKLHLSRAFGRAEQRPEDDGYELFHWSHHPTAETYWSDEDHAYIAWLKSRGDVPPELVPGSAPPGYGRKKGYRPGVDAKDHQTTWCAEEAAAFIDRPHDRPWLLSINPFDPHPPFNPPAAYFEKYDPAALPGPIYRPSDLALQQRLRDAGIEFQTEPKDPQSRDINEIIAAYYAMITLVDDAVGTMLDALERTGQRDNTLVIFTSDHGETLGDHGLLQKGCRFYEGLVRVPLIFSWPNGIDSGRQSDALVELTDIVPTLLELAGVEAPDKMVGRSLLPLLRGEGDDAAHRPFVQCEYHHVLSLQGLGFDGSYGSMIRDRRHKLIAYHGSPEKPRQNLGELYDLEADPNEHDNRWDDPAFADVRFALLKQLFDATARSTDLGPPQTGQF